MFLGDFSFVRIFLKNYHVTMTTAFDTSCSENTMVLSEGEGFCIHVFSSRFYKSVTTGNTLIRRLYITLISLRSPTKCVF
jgi:hypothetical protein